MGATPCDTTKVTIRTGSLPPKLVCFGLGFVHQVGTLTATVVGAW